MIWEGCCLQALPRSVAGPLERICVSAARAAVNSTSSLAYRLWCLSGRLWQRVGARRLGSMTRTRNAKKVAEEPAVAPMQLEPQSKKGRRDSRTPPEQRMQAGVAEGGGGEPVSRERSKASSIVRNLLLHPPPTAQDSDEEENKPPQHPGESESESEEELRADEGMPDVAGASSGTSAMSQDQLEKAMTARLDEIMMTQWKHLVGQMVKSMVSGLIAQVAEVAEAQKVTHRKIERVGSAISEVRERLVAAEGRERERDERMPQRIEALQEKIGRMSLLGRRAPGAQVRARAGPLPDGSVIRSRVEVNTLSCFSLRRRGSWAVCEAWRRRTARRMRRGPTRSASNPINDLSSSP